MPRHSAEERAAAFYRAGKKPATPPRGISPAARRIWRDIVNSKPVDWFDVGSLQLLRLHCENVAAANEVSARLSTAEVGSTEFSRCAANAKMLGSAIATSARQLRLTVQHAIEYHERTKLREVKPAPRRNGADNLTGGRAAWNGQTE
jgi:hypothetical protein